jgi:hypothetical protein
METTGNSEIARFLQEMEQHYAATQYGLSGLAVGTIRHSFITTRMERMGCTHEEWQRLVRPEQAIALVAETLQAQGATRPWVGRTAMHFVRRNVPGGEEVLWRGGSR